MPPAASVLSCLVFAFSATQRRTLIRHDASPVVRNSNIVRTQGHELITGKYEKLKTATYTESHPQLTLFFVVPVIVGKDLCFYLTFI